MEHSIVAYHHISRTGGAALVRRMSETGPGPSWRMFDVEVGQVANGEIDVQDLVMRSNLLLHSHAVFGLHQVVKEPVSYFTIIREPVAHIVSEFYWSNGFDVKNSSQDEIIALLWQYVSSFDHLNHQTYELATLAQERHLGSVHPSPAQMTGTGETLLPRALRYLHEFFEFVGRTEEVDATHAYLEQRFGFIGMENAALGFHNASLSSTRHGKSRREGLPSDLVKLIETKTEIDRLLYDARGFIADQEKRSRVSSTPAVSEQYVCQLGRPWNYFIQGLIAIGARFEGSGIPDEAGVQCWKMRFNLPVNVPAGATLLCRLQFTPYLYRDAESVAVNISVRAGEASARYSKELLQGAREVSLGLPIRAEDHRGRTVSFDIEVTAGSSGGRIDPLPSRPNPVPFMLQSILLSEMLLVNIGSNMSFGMEGVGGSALATGFGAPQVGGLAWTVSKRCRILFRISPRSLELLQAAGIVGEGSPVAVELTMDPLKAPDKGLFGQTVIMEVPGFEPRTLYLSEMSTVQVLLPADISTASDGFVCLDFTFPDAVPLSEVIDHPDQINPHAVMFYNLRLLKYVNLAVPIRPVRTQKIVNEIEIGAQLDADDKLCLPG